MISIVIAATSSSLFRWCQFCMCFAFECGAFKKCKFWAATARAITTARHNSQRPLTFLIKKKSKDRKYLNFGKWKQKREVSGIIYMLFHFHFWVGAKQQKCRNKICIYPSSLSPGSLIKPYPEYESPGLRLTKRWYSFHCCERPDKMKKVHLFVRRSPEFWPILHSFAVGFWFGTLTQESPYHASTSICF